MDLTIFINYLLPISNTLHNGSLKVQYSYEHACTVHAMKTNTSGWALSIIIKYTGHSQIYKVPTILQIFDWAHACSAHALQQAACPLFALSWPNGVLRDMHAVDEWQ